MISRARPEIKFKVLKFMSSFLILEIKSVKKKEECKKECDQNSSSSRMKKRVSM